MTVTKVIAFAAMFLCAVCAGGVGGIGGIRDAVAENRISDHQKASITISGSGVSPNADIWLMTGAQQKIVAKANSQGQFTFSNLGYLSFANLKFSLDIPPYTQGLAQNFPSNHLEFLFDPRGSTATVSGNIGKSGTLAFNLQGSAESVMRVAGNDGSVEFVTRTSQGLAAGNSELLGIITNVGEACCPRLIVPAPPINLMISSVASTPSVAAPSASTPAQTPVKAPVAVPYIHSGETPVVKKEVAPKESVAPSSPSISPLAPPPAKKKIPYIVQGYLQTETVIVSDDEMGAAVSFSDSDYDRTYVGGLKSLADEVRNSVLSGVGAVGGFLDGRTMLDSLRSMQVSTTKTLKNYTPSEAICRFGTLSKALVAGSDTVHKNKLAFGKLLLDRNNQVKGMLYSDAAVGSLAIITDIKEKYCDESDNNGFLNGYCSANVADADKLYNRDVDFTRVFDVPLTLDADFADGAKTNDKSAVIALFQNLSLASPYGWAGEAEFDPRENSLTVQEARSINAARSVAGNSFATLVAEKAKSTATSAGYMQAILEQLGLSADEAKKLIGTNPSYFAQMEVMTKKLFQNPSFYANLYESEANIDRQRVAMKAVELQQDRDLLESLRRREMLLSVFLNMKLKDAARDATESGILVKK